MRVVDELRAEEDVPLARGVVGLLVQSRRDQIADLRQLLELRGELGMGLGAAEHGDGADELRLQHLPGDRAGEEGDIGGGVTLFDGVSVMLCCKSTGPSST